MARGRSTFGKLQRDQAKKDRAKAKMDDRLSRREDKAAASEQATDTPQPTRSTRRSCSSSLPPFTRTWQRAASPWTTSRYARRNCAPNWSSESGASGGRGVAPFEPAAEAGRVRVHPVHDVELLLVGSVDVAEHRIESGCQRVGDVGTPR